MREIEKDLLADVCGGYYCFCLNYENNKWGTEGMGAAAVVLNLVACWNVCCVSWDDDINTRGYAISQNDIFFNPYSINKCAK